MPTRLLPSLWGASVIALAAIGCHTAEPRVPAARPAPRVASDPSPHRCVSVAELERLLASPQSPVVIDVRARTEYDAFHIPGAIPRAVHELVHSGATRAGDPILVASDDDLGRLAGALDTLRKRGRDLRVLSGGMAAWCASGRATIGRCAALEPAGGDAAVVASGPPTGRTYLSRGVDGVRQALPFVAPKEGCGCL